MSSQQCGIGIRGTDPDEKSDVPVNINCTCIFLSHATSFVVLNSEIKIMLLEAENVCQACTISHH